MKITILPIVFLLIAASALAKSPVQIRGVIESSSYSADGATFVITGTLDIADSHSEAGHRQFGGATLRLFHTKVVAKKYTVLLSPDDQWHEQDRRAFDALVSVSRDLRHEVRGGIGGLSITFTSEGNPASLVADSISLLDATLVDKPGNQALLLRPTFRLRMAFGGQDAGRGNNPTLLVTPRASTSELFRRDRDARVAPLHAVASASAWLRLDQHL